MTAWLPAVAAAALILTGAAARAEMCRVPADKARSPARTAQSCQPGERLEPYEPDRVAAGSRPGTIRIGNDTEIRIGGRVRVEYDVRR